MCMHTTDQNRICDDCARKAWDAREGRGISHKQRTSKQPSREARERARTDRQAERIAKDNALKKK